MSEDKSVEKHKMFAIRYGAGWQRLSKVRSLAEAERDRVGKSRGADRKARYDAGDRNISKIFIGKNRAQRRAAEAKARKER